MKVAFYVCFLGIALLYVTLWRYEMASKNAGFRLRALKRKLGGDEAVAARGRSAAPSVQA
jgi:heme exporter protein C